VEETSPRSETFMKACPECGAKAALYRTPRGLRCADCVKRLDSGGLGFR
jgi:hypothetical protein